MCTQRTHESAAGDWKSRAHTLIVYYIRVMRVSLPNKFIDWINIPRAMIAGTDGGGGAQREYKKRLKAAKNRYHIGSH